MLHKAVYSCLIVFFALLIIAAPHTTNSDNRPETTQFFRRTVPDIDKFIGHWKDAKSRTAYGALEVRDILKRCYGNPLRPVSKGAVLTDINAVSYGLLKAAKSTTPATLNDRQLIFYIVTGEGTIQSGDRTAELREGIGIIMPPKVEFSITNTGKLPLTMYIIEEPIPKDFTPNSEMVVKDEYDNTISTNIRRVESTDWLFSMIDGLSTIVAFNPVMYEPASMVPPHVHPEGVEEVWIAIRGDMQIQVGKQRRKFPAGSAYKVPADGITPHLNVNTTKNSKKLIWMMKVPLPEGPVIKKPPKKETQDKTVI